MAKTAKTSTAVTKTEAPGIQEASPSATAAETSLSLKESPKELEGKDPMELMDAVGQWLAQEAGDQPDTPPTKEVTPGEDEQPEGAEEKEEKEGQQTPPAEKESVLPDDDEDSPPVDPEAEAGDDKLDAALQKRLFKLREAKRELKGQLEAKNREIEELKSAKTKEASSLATIPDMPPAFSHIRSAKELEDTEEWLTNRMELVADNPYGFTDTDEATGNEVERDEEWVKEHKKAIRAWQRQLPKAREALSAYKNRRGEATGKASKLYPFVSNKDKPQHAKAREIAERYPELAAHPDFDLMVGRMAVAELVESGAYQLQRPQAEKPKKTDDPPPQAAPVAQTPTQPSLIQPAQPRLQHGISGNSNEAIDLMMAFLNKSA